MTTADENLIKKWDAKFEAMRKERSRFEQQWHLNMAFYFGRQWVVLNTKSVNNTAGYVLMEPRPSDAWRVRAVRNKIKRIIRNEFTKLTKEEPQAYVVPSTTEDTDRMAAVAAEALAEYYVDSSNFKNKRTQATFWALLCGTGFLKTYYDPVAKSEDGLPGKVTYDAVSAFHLFAPFLHLIDLEEQPYVCHARTVDADLVYSNYDKTVQPTVDSSSVIDQRFMRTLGIEQPKETELKQAYIKEWWVKPCREYPEGAMFIYCDKTLLSMNERPAQQEKELSEGPVGNGDLVTPTFEHPGLPQPEPIYPYEHGKFPFQKIDHIPTGMFYAESTIKDLIPIQKDYNKIRSQVIEHRNTSTRPQYWFHMGAIETKHWSTKPGLLLPVRPGYQEPKPIDHPELPAQIQAEIEWNVREMDDVSGQFEISKGRTPPGVEAASAIAFLQEETDTIIYHTVRSIEEAVESAGRQTLDLTAQYWNPERITRIISKNNELESQLFKDVSVEVGMDYKVVSGSMEPRSRAAKQAIISDLIKNGAITPEKGLKYMYMSETNALYEEMQVDVNHARRENLAMARGQQLLRPTGEYEIDPATGQQAVDPNTMQPIPVYETMPQPVGMVDPVTGQPTETMQIPVTTNPFDNDEVHIDEHSRYMKSQQYETLPPETKKIFLDHLEEHKQRVMSAMQEQMMQEQQPQEEMGQPAYD